MAKITLTDRENGKVITIITDAAYIHDLPCIGDDGMLYNIHKIWNDEKHFHTDNIVLIDEKQGFFLSINRGIDDEHLSVENFQKYFFDLSKSTNDYVLLNDVFKDIFNTKNEKIIKLIENNENFNCAHSLVFNRPEDLIESRTSWEDLREYFCSLVYLLEDILDTIKDEE